MKLFRSIEDQHLVDKPGYQPPPPPPDPKASENEESRPRYNVSPVGLALVCAGAAGMAISVFLPFLESTGLFSQVKENTLIQQEGWPLIVVALAAVVTGYRNYSGGRRGWAPIVWGLLGLAFAIKIGSDKSLRTLFPIGSNGELNTTEPGKVAAIGIGVYVAGAAGLVTAFGGFQMRKSPLVIVAPEEPTMRCPECAETILAAARVCKHCGHRFDSPDTAEG